MAGEKGATQETGVEALRLHLEGLAKALPNLILSEEKLSALLKRYGVSDQSLFRLVEPGELERKRDQKLARDGRGKGGTSMRESNFSFKHRHVGRSGDS